MLSADNFAFSMERRFSPLYALIMYIVAAIKKVTAKHMYTTVFIDLLFIGVLSGR